LNIIFKIINYRYTKDNRLSFYFDQVKLLKLLIYFIGPILWKNDIFWKTLPLFDCNKLIVTLILKIIIGIEVLINTVASHPTTPLVKLDETMRVQYNIADQSIFINLKNIHHSNLFGFFLTLFNKSYQALITKKN